MAGDARRYQGVVIEWDDQKGCGFIRPRGSGANDPVVFLGRHAMLLRNRQPAVQDEVTYELTTLPSTESNDRLRTKLRAERVLFLDEELPSVIPLIAPIFGVAYLAILFLIGFFASPALVIAGVSLALSLVSYAMYGWDKSTARRGAWRVSESNLQWIALLGGWPGAAHAQKQFRHKTRKASFQRVFWLAVIVNIAATATLIVWLG